MRSEMIRQAGLLDAGERIVQETRHFHEDTGQSTPGAVKKKPRITATSRSLI